MASRKRERSSSPGSEAPTAAEKKRSVEDAAGNEGGGDGGDTALAAPPKSSSRSASSNAASSTKPAAPRSRASHGWSSRNTKGAHAASVARSKSLALGTAVTFSTLDRSNLVFMTNDRRQISGTKGFRMVRATHGVSSGTWFFEFEISRVSRGTATPHWRLGWANEFADLQGPVGLDLHSYGLREVNGAALHRSERKAYGPPFGPGDVIGCMIRLPRKGFHRVLRRQAAEWDLGIAFEDVTPASMYFPAASVFGSAVVRLNPGPEFKFPPDLDAFRCRPLSAVPPENRRVG